MQTLNIFWINYIRTRIFNEININTKLNLFLYYSISTPNIFIFVSYPFHIWATLIATSCYIQRDTHKKNMFFSFILPFCRCSKNVINFYFLFLFILFLQSFIWPLARSASPEENVIVELRSQTTKILLKTGLGTPSTSRAGTSRGTICSNSKIVGRYVMLMQGK